MKTKEFADKLFNELKEELELYADLGALPVRRVTGAIHSIQIAFEKLTAFVAANGFATEAEEIHFFKKEKPRFTAEHYYAMEIFSIETARPLNDLELLKTFYEHELTYVHRFLAQNKFLYAYYQFDLTDLDHSLFIRGAKPVDLPMPDMIGGDFLFTTCCDGLWGRFIAFERLTEWLNNEIRSLNKNEQLPASADNNVSIGTMKWTGESINLVEIAYGVWLTGQVNNGQTSITEIVEFLERAFRVRIGKPHRRWQGIANRKRLGYTRYLDACKAAIEKRVEEEIRR
jgi:hypothetical protein